MDITGIVGVLLIILMVIALIVVVYLLYLIFELSVSIKKRKKIMKRNEDHLKYHINRLDVMNKSLHNNVPEMVEKLKEISKDKKHE